MELRSEGASDILYPLTELAVLARGVFRPLDVTDVVDDRAPSEMRFFGDVGELLDAEVDGLDPTLGG